MVNYSPCLNSTLVQESMVLLFRYGYRLADSVVIHSSGFEIRSFCVNIHSTVFAY